MRVLHSIILLLFLGCTMEERSYTKTLNLSNQNLTIIPDSVFTLTKLEYLDLGNSFTIYPPMSSLGGTDEPKSLNQLTAIPEDIVQLQQLKVLCVRYNDLKFLPNGLAKLGKLDTLDVSFNRNLSLSKEINKLKQMKSLRFLNVTATNFDQAVISELRNSLPHTSIISDLKYEVAGD